MQLPDKSGITCDHCGLACKHDFCYYSVDFRRVEMVDGARPSLQQILHLTPESAMDLCTKCFDDIKASISNTFKLLSNSREVRCDLTGEVLRATVTYYYCIAAFVTVKIPKAGKAQIKAVDRMAEFNCSTPAYTAFRQPPPQNPWTTNS